jgi:hypothetical protein
MNPNHPSHPHVVRLPISRTALGDARFARTFKAVRCAAHLLSGDDCHIQAVYEDHQRTGYVFAFRTAMQALRLALYHRSVVEGRPIPLKVWC